MPKDKEELQLLYNKMLRSAIAPRPYTVGILSNSEDIKGDYKVPDGLTEEQAMLATLGAIMDEKVMEQAENKSSPSGAILDWKRTHFIRDYFGNDEKRAINYHEMINDGRALAKQAFEEYAGGDHTKVNEMIARASKAITNNYLKSPVEANSMWFSSEAAMNLVIEASTNDEMKKITGYDGKIQKVHEEKQIFSDIAKDHYVIQKELNDAGSKGTLKDMPDYGQKLLELTADTYILRNYNKESLHSYEAVSDLEIYNYAPSDNSGNMIMKYALSQGYQKLNEECTAKYDETHPHNLAVIMADKEKAAEYKKGLKDALSLTSDYKEKKEHFGTSPQMLFGFKYPTPETRTEEKIAADEAQWKQYSKEFPDKAKKAFADSVDFERKIADEINKIKKEYNAPDLKVIGLERFAADTNFGSLDGMLRQKIPVYLVNLSDGKLYRMHTEDYANFITEHVDKIPDVNISEGIKRAYANCNVTSKTLAALEPLMNSAVNILGKDSEAKKAYEDFKAEAGKSFENYTPEQKQKVLESAEKLRESCRNLENKTLKDAIDGELAHLGDRYVAADKEVTDNLEAQSEKARTYSAVPEDDILKAVKEHEKFAESEKIIYKDKAAGDRSLESCERMAAILDSMEKEIEANPELKEKFAGAVAPIKELNEFSKKLYERDEDGNLPVFDGEKQQEFLKISGSALKAAGINVDAGVLFTNIKKAFGDLEKMTAADIARVSYIVPDGKSSLAKEIEKSEPVKVNATGKDFSTVGAVSNLRKAMIINKDGDQISGFFTADKLYAADPEALLDIANEVLDEMDASEKFRKAINFAIKDNLEKMDFADRDIESIAEDYIKLYGFDGVPANEEDLFDLKLYTSQVIHNGAFETGWNGYLTQDTQYKNNLAAKPGTNITNRNIAMSKVANILGVPGLLAKSESMQIEDGDKVISGVFMENAEGKSYDSILPEDIANIDEHPFDNPSVLKDIADIQIIDYICQNVDRHERNLFYKFSEDGKKIVGIQGIDNDFSFGTVKISAEQQINQADTPLSNITVISQSMKEKLDNLDSVTFKASLGGLGLKEEEIQAAADRLVTVKERIAEKKIEILSDEQFKTKTVNELAKGKTLNSVMARCNRMDKNIKAIAKSNLEKKIQKEQAEALLDENEKPKPFKFEKVEELNGISPEQFGKDALKAAELGELILKSQKRIWGSGSNEFKNMEKAVKAFGEIADTMPSNPSRKDYQKFQAALEKTIETADSYLSKKGEKSGNKKTQERIELAKAVKQYCGERLESFKYSLHRKDEIQVEEANAGLKALAGKVGKIQEKAGNQLKNLMNTNLPTQVMGLEIDCMEAKQKMQNQADGTIPMVDNKQNARLIAKVVLQDIIMRERIHNNGKGFIMNSETSKTYKMGGFEKAVAEGHKEELLEAISNLDVVKNEAANMTPDKIGKLAQSGGISQISTKAMTDMQKTGNPFKSELPKSLVKDEKQLDELAASK